jgi:hypothetical protein
MKPSAFSSRDGVVLTRLFALASHFALLCAPHLRIAAAAALTASTGPATCPMCKTAKYRGFVLPLIGDDHAYARLALGWSVSSNRWTTPSQSPCLVFDGRTRTDLANVAVPPWWDSMTRLSASAPISFIMPTRRKRPLKLFVFKIARRFTTKDQASDLFLGG